MKNEIDMIIQMYLSPFPFRISIERRDELIEADPEVYYMTDHYLDHPMILVRLSTITRPALKALIRTAWEELDEI